MNFNFRPIDDEFAEIVQSWDYDNKYVCYDIEKNRVPIDRVLKSDDFQCIIALNDEDEPIGFLAVIFDDDGNMEMENFINPEYVGFGIGVDFISESVDYVVEHFDYDGPSISLIVEPHNKRAIKVYERAGFQIYDECEDWVEMQIDV